MNIDIVNDFNIVDRGKKQREYLTYNNLLNIEYTMYKCYINKIDYQIITLSFTLIDFANQTKVNLIKSKPTKTNQQQNDFDNICIVFKPIYNA